MRTSGVRFAQMSAHRFPFAARTLLVASLALIVACSGAGPDGGLGTAEEAVVVCAKGPVVYGVDVSSWQGSIDWKAVKSSGKDFAFARVSDGSYIDKDFPGNWTGMKGAGLLRGVYQYFEPGEDPGMQADILVSRVGKLGDGDLPAVLDVEATGGQSPATITAHIHTWMDKVTAGTGKKPMIYTGKYFWNDNVKSADFSSYGLWIAAYGPTCPDLPTAWSDWKFFQYTDKASVSGISGGVDGDKFNGSLADLQALASVKPVTPAWGGKWVSQSYPDTMHVGDVVAASIEMKNVGSATWNGNTKLATTVARDRSSVFAGSDWTAAHRPDVVSGTVAPGASYKFSFMLHAPAKPGVYTEHWGMVQESTAWFSDPGEGGPVDDQIWFKITVLPRDGTLDGGPSDGGSAELDAGPIGNDTGSTGPFADTGAPAATPDAQDVQGGCGCSTPRSDSSTLPSLAHAIGLGLALSFGWRRRRRAVPQSSTGLR